MVNTYDEYAALESSEKETLATIEASEKLAGWVLHSGAIWKIEEFDESVIVKLNEDGTSFAEVSDLGSVAAGTFFNDRENKILYLEAFDSDDPSEDFIFFTKRLFFSQSGVNAPKDPDDADSDPIHWEPHILSTSEFGLELDNENQLGFAIEGSGSLTLINDLDFWPANYTKLFFENHKVKVYSWTRQLPITEAKLLFSGRVQRKRYSEKRITFRVNDMLSELRGKVSQNLTRMEDVAGVRIPENLNQAFARRIYGRVFGHKPTNIDQILNDGYPLTGTLTFTNGSATVTGTGTEFLKELSPDDEITIPIPATGETETVSVGSITSDTAFELSEDFPFNDQAGSYDFVPNVAPKFVNRVWQLAGHTLRQPEVTVVQSASLNFIELTSTRDMETGDDLFFDDTGEVKPIQRTSGNFAKLNETLVLAPADGSDVIRPCVQNLKINNKKLLYNRDFTVDPDAAGGAKLTLTEVAEFNIASIRDLNGTLTFTSGSRTVTGSGTNFTTFLKVGYHIRPKGSGDFFEVGSIIDDSNLELRVVSTVTDTDSAQYKPVEYFDPERDTLSCDILGLTDTGDIDGQLLSKGAEIVKHLIEDVGITDINTASFDESANLADQDLGLVIPEKFDDKTTGSYRSEINKVNVSVFGSLIQNNDFELQYNILSPGRDVSIQQFQEFDVIGQFKADTSNEKMAKDVVIEYLAREFRATTMEDNTTETQTATSKTAQYILQTDREKRVETLLTRPADAEVFSYRWRHILELGTTILEFETKLQGASLQVNDRIMFIHRQFYERVGGGRRKVSAIQSIKKSGDSVKISAEDLSDSFNRNSTITENNAADFNDSGLDVKIVNGFITQNTGILNNDRQLFGLHTIW